MYAESAVILCRTEVSRTRRLKRVHSAALSTGFATIKETPVSKLRVNAFSVSADGFGAGPDQGRDQPLGRGGEQLHQWFLPTRTFQRNVLRRDGGITGIDAGRSLNVKGRTATTRAA